MCYHVIRNVVFVVFGGTLLRPTAGAVVVFIPKCTTLRNVPWLCASIQEESYAISLWLSTATSAVNIAYMGGATATEAANSLSAAVGPALSTTRNPIANLASDSATAGLAWVRVCVLWRPGASVQRTQAERWLYCATPWLGMIFTKPGFNNILRRMLKVFSGFVGDATQVGSS